LPEDKQEAQEHRLKQRDMRAVGCDQIQRVPSARNGAMRCQLEACQRLQTVRKVLSEKARNK